MRTPSIYTTVGEMWLGVWMLLLITVTMSRCLAHGPTVTMNQYQRTRKVHPHETLSLRRVHRTTPGKPTVHKLYTATKTRGADDDLPFRNPALAWDVRVDDLVSRLTLEEIVVQTMTSYNSPGTPGVPRLGIAPYPWITECLHGPENTGGTAFPQALGLSAAFSPELMYNVSTAISTEARAHWNLNVKRGVYNVYNGLTCYDPVVNIMRHPLWGRNQETFGEDPYLTGTLSQHYVHGLQGNHPRYRRTTATCKHFDAHGGPEDIPVSRFDFDARVTDADWWNTFLPQFKMCVGAGAGGIMCSYNSLNGIPACVNKKLLDIARKDWNFTGYITSDAGALDIVVTNHHYLPNNTMTAAAALKAGCNMEIMGSTLNSTLDALKHGLLTEKQIRDNVKPLFYVRMRQGEFDPPSMNPYSKIDGSVVQSAEHRELAIRAAMMSFVLLKNDADFLPVKNKFTSLAMVGPMTHDAASQAGDYPPNVSPDYAKTPYDTLVKLSSGTVHAEPGCSDTRCEDYDPVKVQHAVSNASLVIVSLGLGPSLEGEMNDRETIDLPGSQFDLLQDAVFWAKGKPVVVLLFTAGPIDLTWAMNVAGVTAILQVFYPAQATGEALLRTITMTGPGPSSPAGRLSSTWPAYVQQVGPICNYNMYGRTYRYYNGNPLFPFGYGLSYSRFMYTDLSVTPSTLAVGQNLTVQVKVKNIGNYTADEVVQVYMSWENSTIGAPKLQLVGFRRVSTTPGQVVSLQFTVTSQQMALWTYQTHSYTVPTGEKRIYVGGQQPGQRMKVPSNILETTFSVA